MSMMTSLYPPVHGVNVTPLPKPLSPGITTLAEILDDSYNTAGFISGTYLKSDFGFNQGFQVFNDDFQGQRPCSEVNKKINGWFKAITGTGHPFFLFVHYFDPHFPYRPPKTYIEIFNPEYSGKSLKRKEFLKLLEQSEGELERADTEEFKHVIALYDGEIRFADECLGEILDLLKEKGEFERTLIVITSDHGETFLDHPNQWTHGRTLYNEVIHVPLVIKLPGAHNQNPQCDAIVEHIDIAPTILDILGLPTPSSMQGSSFLALLKGDSAQSETKPRRTYSELIKVKDEAKKKIVLESLISRKWKLIFDREKDSIELYDIKGDPKEQLEVSHEQPEIVAALLDTLKQLSEKNRLMRVESDTAKTNEYDEKILEELRALGYFR